VNASESHLQRADGERDVSKFTSRLSVASVLLIVFGGLSLADATGFAGMPAGWWLLPVAVGLAVAATDELVRLHAKSGLLLPGRLLRPGVAAIVLAAIVRPPQAEAWAAAAMAVPVIVYLGLVLAVLAVAVIDYRPERAALTRAASAVFVASYLGLLLAMVVCVRFVAAGEGRPSILPILSLVVVVKAGDVAAYLVGVAVGRTPMAPVLSPGKTWEGAAAGIVGSLAAAWLVLVRFAPVTAAVPAGGWFFYGIAVALAGMLGDLVESLLKRELHAKDSGGSLGGLGGVLDMIDSLLVAAPVAWLLWALGTP